MKIHSYSTGFLEIPNSISLNIYAVGCKHNCYGCSNEKLKDFNYENSLNISIFDFISIVKKHKDIIENVCWLGGDVLFQKDDFVKYSRELKRLFPTIRNCLYTGFELKEISNDVLDVCDIIKTGKWTGIPVTDETSNQCFWINKDLKWFKFNYNQLSKVITEGKFANVG